jgi:SsrA-binding protein
MAKKKAQSGPPTVENRKARHDYDISDTLEVGIVLAGSEVKSVRDGRVSLAEGYVRATSNPLELTLYGANIGEYPPAAHLGHRPVRPRRLLAHKREIRDLARLADSKGVTIVPLKLYFKNGFAKLLIGVGRGKTKGDKRRALADREARRDIERAMSKRM